MKIKNEQINIESLIQNFSDTLPHFPDGRIDYTASDKAVVLTCFVKCENKILLLKRSNQVRAYQNMWNTVAGYVDKIAPIKDKILEELQEELGLSKENIKDKDIKIGKIYEFTDAEINKIWVIIPCLVAFKKYPIIKLDWEHTDYKWINPEEINDFFIVPNLEKSLKNIL